MSFSKHQMTKLQNKDIFPYHRIFIGHSLYTDH